MTMIVKPSSCLFFGLFFLAACSHYRRNKSHKEVPVSSIRRGEELAKVYCQSCHLLPDPALLDAGSWEKGVLPGMGPRLGIFRHNFDLYPSSLHDTNLSKGFYPAQPLVSPEDWEHILDYYTALSPDSLPAQQRQRQIRDGLTLFKVEAPPIMHEAPATCLTRVDTGGGRRGLWVYDEYYKQLYRWSASFDRVDSLPCQGAIVDITDLTATDLLVCNIGLLGPNNGKFGKIQSIHMGLNGKAQGGHDSGIEMDSMSLAGHLARPVQLSAADLNRDGRVDILVCEFGNLTGALSWLENMGKGRYERHVIKASPGAIRAVITDYDHDGRPDILVLFAQGDEGIFLFTNKGGGQFSERVLLRFPPMYGSTYFELADLNKDGLPDILYTCGDNADLSPVLKPYHGVYIFINKGDGQYEQAYFFPINGCYKALARDFDGDGDPDIAAISFFADYDRQPEEGFVFLQNRGGMDFQPYSLAETQTGKWLTMDAADLDGDGRIDIVLGNFSFFSPVTKKGVNFAKGPSFLLLRNQGK